MRRYLSGLAIIAAGIVALAAHVAWGADVPIRQYPVCEENNLPEIAHWVHELDRQDQTRIIVVSADRVAALKQQLIYDNPDVEPALFGMNYVIGYEADDDDEYIFVYKMFANGCPVGDGWADTEWLFGTMPAYSGQRRGKDI